jgi:hypothetical protein
MSVVPSVVVTGQTDVPDSKDRKIRAIYCLSDNKNYLVASGDTAEHKEICKELTFHCNYQYSEIYKRAACSCYCLLTTHTNRCTEGSR